MTIKVSTLLAHNTTLVLDIAPSLGGPLNTNNYPIVNGGNPVTITGNEYPTNTGAAGQVLTTNGFGILSWTTNGSGTVTSVGVSSIGTYGPSLTIASSPVTSAGTITITPNIFTATTPGVVAGSGGGTAAYLRADGTWAVPPGSAGTASNILGGAANEILFQTAPNTTSFISAPGSPNTFLEWNGTNFTWVANGSGSVTSVGLTSPAGTIVITGSPNPITTAGTFNVDLPLSGVTSATYGSASSVGVITVNSHGIVTSASNASIAITPTQAGLGNVVNSLQVINAGGAPSIQEGAGIPLGSAATGAIYIDQNGTNGNTQYYYNGTSWVVIANKLNLYAEKSAVGFVPPAALANNSIALGEGAQANAVDSLAIGLQSISRIQGGVVQASGRFGSSGDAQAGKYLLRNITTNNAPTILYVDGVGGSVQLLLTDFSTWSFKAMVTAHQTSVGSGHAGYQFSGVIYRMAGAATTTSQGQVSKSVISESNPAWDVNVTADIGNGALHFSVVGELGKVIRWVAVVETVEITN